MTAPTRTVRRRPSTLATVAGMAVVLLLIGAVAWGAGFCLAWVSDLAWGAP